MVIGLYNNSYIALDLKSVIFAGLPIQTYGHGTPA